MGSKSRYIHELNSWEKTHNESINGLSGCSPVEHQEHVRERYDSVKPGERDEVSHFERLKLGGKSPTLRAGSNKSRGTHTGARPIHPIAPRVITVRESARLQSFPDWFQFHETKYYGIRQVGNSVPPLLAKQIAGEVRRATSQVTNNAIVAGE